MRPPCGVMPSVVAIASGTAAAVGERRELDHPHPVGVLVGELGAHLDRQPGLADTADAGQGHQPVAADQLDEVGRGSARGR